MDPSRLEGHGLNLLHEGETQSALHGLLQALEGRKAPHGDGEGCRDESAYNLL